MTMVPWIDSCVRCMALFLTCFFFDNGTAAMSCQFILPRHQLCLVVPILSLRSLPHDSACKSGATCRERASSSKLLAECLPPQCCLPPLGPPPPCAPAHRLGMVAAATGVGDRVCGGDSARGCWRPTGAAAFAWCLTDLAGTGRWKAILGCGSRRLVGTAAFARSLTATARLEAMVACAQLHHGGCRPVAARGGGPAAAEQLHGGPRRTVGCDTSCAPPVAQSVETVVEPRGFAGRMGHALPAARGIIVAAGASGHRGWANHGAGTCPGCTLATSEQGAASARGRRAAASLAARPMAGVAAARRGRRRQRPSGRSRG